VDAPGVERHHLAADLHSPAHQADARHGLRCGPRRRRRGGWVGAAHDGRASYQRVAVQSNTRRSIGRCRVTARRAHEPGRPAAAVRESRAPRPGRESPRRPRHPAR
jgi:hypothetical protein